MERGHETWNCATVAWKDTWKGLRELREISTVPRSLTLSTLVSRSGKRDMKTVILFTIYIYVYVSCQPKLKQ